MEASLPRRLGQVSGTRWPDSSKKPMHRLGAFDDEVKAD